MCPRRSTHVTELFYFPLEIVFPPLLPFLVLSPLFCLHSAVSAFFPSFFSLLSIDLAPFFCSFTLISPQFALSISGLCLCTALWDQIRFTSGLNVCSHGLLHLKGNSFSWNFAVQFETRLMLANFTPPFF